MKKAIFFFTAIALLGAGCKKSNSNSGLPYSSQNTVSSTPASSPAPANQVIIPPPAVSGAAKLVFPITSAKTRITKKFFGTYVTPQSSPVQPERFTGYHTGLDFETFPDEQNVDVPIYAICSGPLLQKRTATGYGGVAVQKCTINNQSVTVVYGHLRLLSIKDSVNEELIAGDELGVLGTGYSPETDGERKHLHLSIHKGSSINIKGYVQNKSELSGWLDPQSEFGL